MSKKSRHNNRPKPTSQFSWLWLVGGGAILLLVAGLALWWGSSGTKATAPRTGGAPRLAVDRTTVDEGYLKLNTSVQTAFRLSNVGTQPLQILGEPQVQLVQGC